MKSIDPEQLNPRHQQDIPADQEKEIVQLAPSEDLTLRVEQIFEDAEQLWQWMHND